MATRAQYRMRAFLLLIPFFIILWGLFMPWYNGPQCGKVNGLDYFDNFFNEVSKGSSFNKESQVKQLKTADGLAGQTFIAAIMFKEDKKYKYTAEDKAQTAAKLLTTAGLQATAEGTKVSVQGDLGTMMKAAVEDSVHMYNNDGKTVADKYGMDERKALYTWHQILATLGKGKDFAKSHSTENQPNAAKALQNTVTKAIEPAYNYYGVKVTPVSQEIPLLAFALVFYVVYTVWYGFGMMYLFEGLGVSIGGH